MSNIKPPDPQPTVVPASHATIVQMDGITKGFPGIVANANVSLTVRKGTFHAVIGENGAGKSTLLNILYGRYRPDQGRIMVREEDVTQALHSPADAIRRGLGLVSQHYSLIPAFTVLENVILGSEPVQVAGVLIVARPPKRLPRGQSRSDWRAST